METEISTPQSGLYEILNEKLKIIESFFQSFFLDHNEQIFRSIKSQMTLLVLTTQIFLLIIDTLGFMAFSDFKAKLRKIFILFVSSSEKNLFHKQ